MILILIFGAFALCKYILLLSTFYSWLYAISFGILVQMWSFICFRKENREITAYLMSKNGFLSVDFFGFLIYVITKKNFQKRYITIGHNESIIIKNYILEKGSFPLNFFIVEERVSNKLEREAIEEEIKKLDNKTKIAAFVKGIESSNGMTVEEYFQARESYKALSNEISLEEIKKLS